MPFCFKMIKNKKAQIVLPAILLIPTILLVIYLLLETTKLSREKIRHQFALDTAAFTELTSASNYLNATAYTNGAFPFRLFRENFTPTEKVFGPKSNPEQKELSLYELFYRGGAFPALGDDGDWNSAPKDTDTEWELKFYTEESEERSSWNNPNPPNISDQTFYPVMSKNYADNYAIGWNPDAVKLYVLIYYFLSQIYEDQKNVYLKLSKEGEFFRKGYYLNVGSGGCKLSECGREGAKNFKEYKVQTEPVYIKKIKFYYVNPDDYSDETREIPFDLEEQEMFDGRLYQYSYVSRSYASKLRRLYKGIDVTQPFKAPSNYFNVNLEKFRPRNHVRAALQCTKESNNCIWPNPTPKYQVRLFP